MSTIFDKAAIEKTCEEFFSLYNVTRGRTREMCITKIIHTRAVAENCAYIAEYSGLNEHDCDLAWTIGELHDFARFGQAIVAKTFRDDDRYNHAKFGAQLLFQHGMIEDIIDNWREIPDADKIVIENAVRYHSNYKLPDDLTERERLFCEIIQEADRVDIFRAIVTSGWQTIYGHSKEEILASDISDEILATFPRHEMADYSKRVLPADYHMAHIALGFGIKSSVARKRAMEQGYLRQMMDIEFSQPTVQEKFLRAKNCVEEFFSQ